MNWRFGGSPEELEALTRSVAEIPDIQRSLVEHHRQLTRPDRAAHQQQIAGGKVVLQVVDPLPPALDGVGLFRPGARATGLGRISTGLGCPHLETDPDFLGLMLAFQTPAGERVDFLGINDPGAPTDTVDEFVSLLVATAAAAGTDVPFGDLGSLDLGNLTVSQAKLFNALRKRLGTMRASGIYFHLVGQTARTARSSSAIQAYWTGVVEARGVHGKFTFVPVANVNQHRALSPGEHYLTEDWARRWREGDVVFEARWIPFLDEERTPLAQTSEAWSEEHAVPVGTATFPRTDPATPEARLLALLAAEMGANPGNWIGTPEGTPRSAYPGTTFTAARQVAYGLSQAGRDCLPQSAYQEYFDTGTVGPALAQELERRLEEKRQAGHAVPRLPG